MVVRISLLQKKKYIYIYILTHITHMRNIRNELYAYVYRRDEISSDRLVLRSPSTCTHAIKAKIPNQLMHSIEVNPRICQPEK